MAGHRKNDILLLKIALVFKALRAQKGLSQQDVYNDTNIHLARIEVGAANLSISTIADLCDYFEVKLSDFFARIEEIEEEEVKKIKQNFKHTR